MPTLIALREVDGDGQVLFHFVATDSVKAESAIARLEQIEGFSDVFEASTVDVPEVDDSWVDQVARFVKDML